MLRSTTRSLLMVFLLSVSAGQALPYCDAEDKVETQTENVILVTLDGFRWQEFFGGAAAELMNDKAGGMRSSGVEHWKKTYWRETPEQRRETLLPFFWGTVAKKGQIFGDPQKGSAAQLANGLKFSYPGYQEILGGFPDPAIDSNDKNPNANTSVLEWLNGKERYKGKVAVFGSWDVLPFILNTDRSKLPVNGDGLPYKKPEGERQELLNEIQTDLPPYWGPGSRFDALTMRAALDCLKNEKPRVMYVLLGETDEWAHGRRYDLYLHAANRSDDFLRRLWETAQSMRQYKGKTTLIVTTDHGRGNTARDWTDHNKDVVGAEYIWIAVMGPDTPAEGVRENTKATQAQVAATLAKVLGEDYNAAQPKAAQPLPGVTK